MWERARRWHEIDGEAVYGTFTMNKQMNGLFSACKDKNAEHTDQHVLDVRVIVHDYCNYANPWKKSGGLPDDMASIQEQLVARIKTPIVNLINMG